MIENYFLLLKLKKLLSKLFKIIQNNQIIKLNKEIINK